MNSGLNRQQLLQEYKLHCEQMPPAEIPLDDPRRLEQQSHEFLVDREVDLSTLGDDERQALLKEMNSIRDSCWSVQRPDASTSEQLGVLPPFRASDPIASPTDQLGLPLRYQALHKIGEGGLGQIWRALDTRLNRQVAIKTPRDEFANHPKLWERLEREAALTSQLQHPGVPPTYDAGRRNSGIPFFSMKLIEGETLASLLKKPLERHNTLSWLNRFSTLVQTIAFAHDHGVIHRDLKPHNVMVGKFGELQVMDWGLARADRQVSLAPVSEAADAALSTETLATSQATEADRLLSLTGAGEVFGTPNYMSPEQARGEVDRLGFASDVFSLGAMLFEMLTGSRLYAEFADEDVLSQAAVGPVGSLPLLDAVDCDARLKELVRHCLRVDPAERPANAGEVAVALNAYFEERDQRLRQAEAEQEKAQLRIEEERKRRRIAMVLVAVLLTGIAGTGWGLSRANVEWQRAEQNAATSESNAQAASKNAQIANDKALLAEQVVKNFYTRIGQEKLFDTPSLQPLRQELLDEALKFYVQATREAPDDLPLQLAHGELLLNSAAATFSRGEAASALQLVEQATDKLQNVLDSSKGAAPELPSPTRTGWTLASQARQYLGRARMYEGIARMRIGRPSECIQLFEQAEEFYQSLAADHPQDIHTRRIKAELYSAWGFLLTGSPSPEAALPLLNQALELRLLITASESNNEYDRHDLARTYWDIGYCQRMMSANSVGDSWEQLLAQAIDNYQRSIEILEPLAEEYPGSMAFQTTLGEVYNTLAVAYLRRNDRGAVSTEERAENNRLAIEAHQQALAAHTRLVAQNPGIEQLEFDLSRSYMNYGVQLKVTGRYQEAMEAYLQSVVIRREIVSRRPHDAVYASGLANTLNNLGLLQLVQLDQVTSAMQHLIEAENIYLELLSQAPDDRKLKMALAAVYLNQGLVHRKQQDWDASVACIDQARETTAGESDQMLTIAKHMSQLAELASEEQAAAASPLRERALETLTEIVAAGHVALVDLEHPDFKWLSDSPKFQACRENLSYTQ